MEYNPELKENIKNQIVDFIQTDEAFFLFVLWSCEKGIKIISKEIEEGRNDEIAQAFLEIHDEMTTKIGLYGKTIH